MPNRLEVAKRFSIAKLEAFCADLLETHEFSSAFLAQFCIHSLPSHVAFVCDDDKVGLVEGERSAIVPARGLSRFYPCPLRSNPLAIAKFLWAFLLRQYS